MNKIGYVSLEEANSYISSSFLSSDEKRKAWEGLSDDDKKVLLRQSLMDIEALNFTGRKTDLNQPYKFPRNGNTEVPENVKYAQIEGAIDRTTNSYFDINNNGIASESVGSVSYTYRETTKFQNNLRPSVNRYLKGYIRQIFRYC